MEVIYMTRQEWSELKIGDICVLVVGDSKGMQGRVVYISGDTACLEALGNEYFTQGCTHRTLTLQNWRNIRIVKN
jgi:hypothetical protein